MALAGDFRRHFPRPNKSIFFITILPNMVMAPIVLSQSVLTMPTMHQTDRNWEWYKTLRKLVVIFGALCNLSFGSHRRRLSTLWASVSALASFLPRPLLQPSPLPLPPSPPSASASISASRKRHRRNRRETRRTPKKKGRPKGKAESRYFNPETSTFYSFRRFFPFVWECLSVRPSAFLSVRPSVFSSVHPSV